MEIRIYTDASVGFAWVGSSRLFVAGMAWKIKRGRRSVSGAITVEAVNTSNLAELMAICHAVSVLCDRLPTATAARATLKLHTDNEYAYKVVATDHPSAITARYALFELLARFESWTIEIRKDTECANMTKVDQLSRAAMKAHRARYGGPGDAASSAPAG